MSQPKWKCIAQIGDDNPLEYNGYWIFIDETGVYPPECEYYNAESREMYRYILEDCTFKNGILSDNKFHPDLEAWFTDEINKVADFIGIEDLDLIKMFVSVDPIERAFAWQAIGDYFGYYNLDTYPLKLTKKEAAQRYNRKQYKVKS